MPDYIYEHKEWPSFRWSHKELETQLASVRHHQGRLIGHMNALGFQLRAEAVLQTITEDVLKSSEIEGEILNKEQVRSSVARRLGMDIGALVPADHDVEGVVEMVLDATQNYETPLTKERLCSWHAALFPTGRSGMHKITVGDWRNDNSGPMQVISGAIGHEHVHYEAPAASFLNREMNSFLKWFNANENIEPVLKAAVAHLWFVTIHPFEDGNGRIARAIADMALAQSEKSPRRFYSMSAQIRIERNDYYRILERTQKGNLDITRWLEWFLECLDRAFTGADGILALVLKKARFWQFYVDQQFNERQRTMINRVIDGFKGNLTSSKWALITKSSQDTASRDIDDLLKRNILFKAPGGGRSSNYLLVVTAADPLNAVATYTRTQAGTSVWKGEHLPTADQKAERRKQIERLADEIDSLAEKSLREKVVYQDFDLILSELHKRGFFPDRQLVSAVAFALNRDQDNPPLLA